MYKRISAAEDERALTELKVELIDRFGPLPDPVQNLFRVTQFKLRAEALGIEKIDAGAQSGRIEFGPTPKVHALNIVKMVQTRPQTYKLEGADQLKFMIPMEEAAERLNAVDTLLETLSASAD